MATRAIWKRHSCGTTRPCDLDHSLQSPTTPVKLEALQLEELTSAVLSMNTQPRARNIGGRKGKEDEPEDGYGACKGAPESAVPRGIGIYGV